MRGENRSTRGKTSHSRVEDQQTQSTWHRVRKSNQGHIGGRQVHSPLGQPCHLIFMSTPVTSRCWRIFVPGERALHKCSDPDTSLSYYLLYFPLLLILASVCLVSSNMMFQSQDHMISLQSLISTFIKPKVVCNLNCFQSTEFHCQSFNP